MRENKVIFRRKNFHPVSFMLKAIKAHHSPKIKSNIYDFLYLCKIHGELGDAQVPWYVPCGGVCYGDGNLVFIANDWHTALLPVYLKAHYRDNGLMKYTRSVLVIHNIAHQVRSLLNIFTSLHLNSEEYESANHQFYMNYLV